MFPLNTVSSLLSCDATPSSSDKECLNLSITQEFPDLAKTLIYTDSIALTVELEVNDDIVFSPRSVAATDSLVVTNYSGASKDDSESLIGDVTDSITDSELDEKEEPASLKSTESVNGDSIVDASEFHADSIFDDFVSEKHDSSFQSSNSDPNSGDSSYGMNTLSLTAPGHLNPIFDPGGATALHEEEQLAGNPVLECDSSLRKASESSDIALSIAGIGVFPMRNESLAMLKLPPPSKPPDIGTDLMLLQENSTVTVRLVAIHYVEQLHYMKFRNRFEAASDISFFVLIDKQVHLIVCVAGYEQTALFYLQFKIGYVETAHQIIDEMPDWVVLLMFDEIFDEMPDWIVFLGFDKLLDKPVVAGVFTMLNGYPIVMMYKGVNGMDTDSMWKLALSQSQLPRELWIEFFMQMHMSACPFSYIQSESFHRYHIYTFKYSSGTLLFLYFSYSIQDICTWFWDYIYGEIVKSSYEGFSLSYIEILFVKVPVQLSLHGYLGLSNALGLLDIGDQVVYRIDHIHTTRSQVYEVVLVVHVKIDCLLDTRRIFMDRDMEICTRGDTATKYFQEVANSIQSNYAMVALIGFEDILQQPIILVHESILKSIMAHIRDLKF